LILLTAEILNLAVYEIYTGMRKINNIEEFRATWAQTWMPESDLEGARELEEFKARLSLRYGKKNG
jgi:hypothetical protein